MFITSSPVGNFREYGKPVVNITMNGEKIYNWQDFSIEVGGLGAVDTFSVTLPWEVTDNPENRQLFSGSKESAGIVYGTAVFKFDVGFEGEEIKSFIEGEVDAVSWDFDDSGEWVKMSGRSFAAKPYDFSETVKYQNFTSTDVHSKICQLYDLNPIQPIKTTTMIGEYINEDHSTLTRDTSHWDLILYLAENEGFVTRLRGKDWYFGPINCLENYEKPPVEFMWGYNVQSGLHIERAPNAARNLTVEVISYQNSGKKGGGSRIVEKASIESSKKDVSKYTIRVYKPNVSRDQAQAFARNKLAELSQQQFFGNFTSDFFPDVDIDRKFKLYGVGKGLSQEFYVTKMSISGSSDGLSAQIDFSNLVLQESGDYK